MRTLFDTSVLVAALVDQMERHEPSRRALRRYTSGANSACCSTHALAEIYSTVSALPIPRRISPQETRRIIEEALLPRVTVVPLTPEDYRTVIGSAAALGLRSGAVYDGLHVQCARRQNVDQILTYNRSDFERFDLGGIVLEMPL